MTYLYWLAGLSIAFILLERLRPRVRQGVWRRGLVMDLFYLVLNGQFLGVLLAAAARPRAAAHPRPRSRTTSTCERDCRS